ncbi:uncharacterized protein BYT42DRAFT_613942 [Radiomyces spectabilis]|uniref:uncharacterized protein n=1 Tax=Radiomyces spectabilis TaxID=64574 RepID=UPI00221EE767|nr:uncharacterized protein BYT42DRAFT_613942 [Radiomyces spectabilis]KAI8379655.1 hypothetical protein BYT42DRAFT_613942 [Radiomyces spectabilis]
MDATYPNFGFDEYIMPTTYAASLKLEPYDAQLYPTTGFGYFGNDAVGFESMAMTPAQQQSSMVMMPRSTPVFDVYGKQQPSSPESVSSRFSSSATPPPLLNSPPATATPTLLSSTSSSTIANSITEKIAKVNKLPESFLPEFHQYSKETYENGSSNNRKRRRQHKNQDDDSSSDQEDDLDGASAAEIRRQIHIQSEQKRRAQIKDGFDELRQHLPGCVNKKMSKAALLHRTVQHMQHLKNNQASLLAELERLAAENEQLRKFQESVLQKQALERMYQMGAM